MRSLHQRCIGFPRPFLAVTHVSRRPLSLLVPVVVGLCATGSHAAPPLPQGGQFVAGSGSIGAKGSSLTINQSSTRGIIDWNSFSIGNGHTVNVNNGTGATLSRVTGTDRSVIDGSLKATGSFYLINPQGVVIGSNGVVTTGGRFVASALDVNNDAFMAGGDLTFAGKGNGSVINLGKISSTGGDVLLIAPALVENDGSISAPGGSAELAAGNKVLVRDSSAAAQTYVETTSHGDAVNKGNIAAAQIALQAADGNVYALAGKNAALRATGTATRDGHVWLVAPKGTTHVHTPIYARNADGSGGTVDTTGAALHLDDADVHAAQWNLNAPVFNVGPSTTATLLKQLNQGTSVQLSATQGDIVLEQTMRWEGDASLTANANRSVTVGPIATLANSGKGNLTLRADASGSDNGGSVTNRGTIDWTKSTGIVSVLYDMTGKWTPGTVRTNNRWSATPFSGLQTQVTAYQLVNSFDDLQKVSQNLTGNYALGRDLDLQGAPTIAGGIGVSSQTGFAGQFDGMRHTISNMRVDDPEQGGNGYNGLFSVIGLTGVVRNLSIENGSAQGNGVTVGMLAGLNRGLVTHVSTSGGVDAITAGLGAGLVGVNEGVIERSSSSAGAFSNSAAAGFVGVNSGSIIQSYSTGSASGAYRSQAGSFVLTNRGTITQSYSTGSADSVYVGGLATDNSGTIRESFASGPVTALSPGMGTQAAISYSNTGHIADNVFWDVKGTGNTVGVFTGTPVPATNGLTPAQMSTASSFGPTWDFSKNGVWVIPPGGTHPILRWQTASQ
ncbi:filamentous hemagglutinin N-terminal domain-containing protein [Caballeronia sp. LZ032]|uniref:two-partner secretion domain-containing protein n=1 Tax=Caballeronia sp. LZ032 TaxID=3038565 RepID=UPI0028543693|nr:filamentous hemagglutinin N-terminal domain-containing protein [Caballeronia sp. LZ032]MDR5884085.1 filamentous hemagglutinin N-terminal domain-containing protein [Caballeronia sp. LZ032]